MPLIKSGSKKAFQKNVETEMKSNPDPKSRAQNLAIAYSIKRKNEHKKKMAQGGDISAANEERPMPESEYDDADEIRQNAHIKPLVDSQWTDAPQDYQASNKPKVQALKHPKMVPQSAYSVKIRSMEDDLEKSAPPASPDEEPPKWMDQEAKRQMMAEGGKPKLGTGKRFAAVEKSAAASGAENPAAVAAMAGRKAHSEKQMEKYSKMGKNRKADGGKMYAEGGEINKEVSFYKSEEDMDESPDGLEEDDDQMRPNEKDYMSGRDAAAYAEGGSIEREEMMQPEDEEEEEHHSSIAAAIMARKDREVQESSGNSTEDMAMHAGKHIEDSHEDEMYHPRMDNAYADGGLIDDDEDDLNDESDDGDVDLDLNAKERPNQYYHSNESSVLKENYDEPLHKIDEPEDSNLMGDEREEESENKYDMVDKIRMKMRRSNQFKR